MFYLGPVHSVKYLRKARTEFTVGGGGGGGGGGKKKKFYAKKVTKMLGKKKFF